MTWQHLQQLRQTAQAEIQKQMALLQPRAGSGVAISGNQISLDEREAEDAPPAFIPISIYLSMEGFYEYKHETGEFNHRYEINTPLERFALTLPNGKVLRYIPRTRANIVAEINRGGYSFYQKGRIRFVQKPFRFPVVLHLGFYGQHDTFLGGEQIPMYSDTVEYDGSRAASGDWYVSIWIDKISKL